MVLFPGCACCGGGITGPCEDCQSFCGYQVTVDKTETADDLTGEFVFLGPPVDDPYITPGKTIAGPTSCGVGATSDYCEFFADGAPAVPTGGKNYYVVKSASGISGRVQSRSTSTLRNTNRGVYWVTDSYSWEPNTYAASTVARLERTDLEWAVGCKSYTEWIDGVLVTTLTVSLTATLTQAILLNGNGTIGPVLVDPSGTGGAFAYDPPYVFDGTYEDEWPNINLVRVRTMAYRLATSCRPPDALTASCLASSNPVIDWRPAYIKVTAEDDGITLTLPSGATFYEWQTDDMPNDVAQWDEYQLDSATQSYVHVFKRAPDGEPYFAPLLPLEKIEWEANFLSTTGIATVAFDDFCGLSLVADEDTIEVPEGAPLPLGEEQAAYVHGYATDVTADTNCPIVTYPSWSVYWKHKHLLITDLNVLRCGEIPSVTTFTVWLYFDGLINDQLTGNEINGVPVGGFVMAVRSWNVTVILGQPPIITPNSSTSPCSAEGDMPFCNGLVPEFEITYV